MDKVHRCCCCLSLRAGVFLTCLFSLIYTLIYGLSSNSELRPTYPEAHSISSQQEFRTGYNHFEVLFIGIVPHAYDILSTIMYITGIIGCLKESPRLIRYYKMHQWFELVYTPFILIYGFLRAFYFDKELKDSTTKLQENLRDEDALFIPWFYIFIITCVVFITLAAFCYQIYVIYITNKYERYLKKRLTIKHS